MNKEIIYSMNTAYRGEYEIQGFSYGSGDKAACIVGAMRGNEFQQLYISSLLAKKLGELEARGAIVSGKKILLIPSINYSSFNVGKKYWITDNSDINRSFPGNPEGQATSRIAAAVMEKVTGYAYGIQFASFYMDGEFIPHVRMIETGKQSNSLASQFGMPYVLTAEPRSYDKATLNYNWQMRGTEAFSVYSGGHLWPEFSEVAMNKEIIYSMNTAYRGEYEIQGFSYGSGDKAACIVGAMRGNEFQQLYISSLLAKKLGELEARGAIVSGKKILLIPSINYSSFNVGKKYWITDNSDINRSFPGNPEGQATSRIAAAVMEKVTGYAYGIQFASFYMDGEFIPHVRMIETGKQSNSLASQFGMPYVLTAEPRSYDKATLNYNWQMRGTEAFSVYSGVTDTINGESANQAVSSVLRFLTRMGVIRYNCHAGYISTIMDEEDLLSIRSEHAAGFFKKLVQPGDEVVRGDIIANIINPMTGENTTDIYAPTDGIIFYCQNSPMIYQNSVIFKMIRRLHN